MRGGLHFFSFFFKCFWNTLIIMLLCVFSHRLLLHLYERIHLSRFLRALPLMTDHPPHLITASYKVFIKRGDIILSHHLVQNEGDESEEKTDRREGAAVFLCGEDN